MMEKLVTSNLKLGIVAGGQLGKMLIQEASKWDIISYVLDSEENCPAGNIASHFIRGSHLDYEAVYNFGKMVDVLTFEIESINVEALKQLKAEGTRVIPDPETLEMIQDKGLQKDFYQANHLPTAAYEKHASKNALLAKIDNGDIGFPFVQKLRKGGYDGRGVAVIRTANDAGKLLDRPCITEQLIDIDKEIAIIAARNAKGELKCYPAVEMIFDPQANLVDKLMCPSTISSHQAEAAKDIAKTLMEELRFEGLLAVEYFVDTDGRIFLNEIAPRPHNSGHHTIEGIITSQFEQHLRAILNLPLGSTMLKLPAVMINILGEEGYEGPVKYEGLTESMTIEGVKIHLYGKKMTRPFRKMGHATILSHTLQDAISKADKVKSLIKVKAWNNHTSAS
jgi:5-(carboxyamino)imidazole ribonucleotide synthase